MLTEQKQPMAKRVPRDTHMQCYKRSQLLHNHYLQNVGQEQKALRQESGHAVLANLLLPSTGSLQEVCRACLKGSAGSRSSMIPSMAAWVPRHLKTVPTKLIFTIKSTQRNCLKFGLQNCAMWDPYKMQLRM